MNLEVDGDGFLIDPSVWTKEIMYELARRDGLELTEEHVMYILDAKKMYEEDGVVPAIRNFAKKHGMDRKAQHLYDLFTSGVMKRIAKYSGMPKPTGCI